MTPEIAHTMIAVIARELANCRHVAVGASSPIPASAALLAQARRPDLRVSILGSEEDNPFTDGGRELFDCAAQGRIDTFFFSGVQIDGQGNINLLGLGQPPVMRRRFVGNFGAPYLAGLIPNIILFRTDHSARALVERVEFVSAPGHNCRLLVTDRAVFRKRDGRFRLINVHVGETVASVRAHTGFVFEGEPSTTSTLDFESQSILSEAVMPRMRRLYPQFAQSLEPQS